TNKYKDCSITQYTYSEISKRSQQLANWLTDHEVKLGDHVMLMLNNQLELWESMLACIRAGFVINPATAMLGTDDLQDRTERAGVSWVIVNNDDAQKFQGVNGDFSVIQIQDGERSEEHTSELQSRFDLVCRLLLDK